MQKLIMECGLSWGKTVLILGGVFLCCYSVAGAEKSRQFGPNNFHNNHNVHQNFTINRRQDDDSIVVAWIRKIFPEMDARLNRVPVNFLQIVLNASGVLGLGFLWIKEISGALGTPILAPILMPPLIILAGAILLIPDLSRLGELVNSAFTK